MKIEASPYAWPFDGDLSVSDTALLLLGFQLQACREIIAADREAGMILVRWRALRGLTLHGMRGMNRLGDLTPPQRWRHDHREVDRVQYRGSRGWQGIFNHRPDEPVIDHLGDNAFYASDLDHLLRCRGIKNLIIAGLPTDGIVHATMRDANDRGFECLLVADACASHSPEIHEGILAITIFGNGLFGAAASTAAVLEALR